jgi:predicted N-acetyltransferase YhbS
MPVTATGAQVLTVRGETPQDAAAIRRVNEQAFGRAAEADLVEALRFGFVPARTFGIACEYPVPDEVFLALELTPGALAGRGGMARYPAEFNAV